jgi:hypothetical protein
LLYFIFHHFRLFGWIPATALAAVMAPRKTALAAAVYAAVHRQPWWQDAVHRALSVGSSRRSVITSPHKSEYDPDKRYLLSIHPHGILLDGIHSSVARHGSGGWFAGNPGVSHPTGVNSSALCFAPIIQHVPVHQVGLLINGQDP